MPRRTTVALLLLACLIAAAAGPAAAQQDGDQSAGGAECRRGELCGSGDFDDRSADSTSNVPETPGRYLRSLITLGLIAAVVGTYLFVAFTGRNPLAATLGRDRRR